MASRMFRVTSNTGCESCGLRVGDVSEFVREDIRYGVAWVYLKALPHWTQNNTDDGCHEVRAEFAEEITPTPDDGIQAIRDAVTKAVATATPAQVIAAASALGLKVEQQTTYVLKGA